MMSTQAPPAGEESSGDALFDQMHEVMHLFRSRLREALRDEPDVLAAMEARALGFFARHDGAAQGDLVRHSGRDKGQVARLVRSLLDRGLLQRDAVAGRRGGLSLTAEGAALHRRLQLQRARLADELAGVLSADERARLGALLRRLKASAEG